MKNRWYRKFSLGIIWVHLCVCLLVGTVSTATFLSTARASVSAAGESDPFTADSVSASRDFTCSRTTDGLINCWGSNSSRQLGNGTSNYSSNYPTSVVGISTATTISSGDLHACAVLMNGTVKCWGEGGSGQLGSGTTLDSNIPVSVVGITNAVSVTSGFRHSCALLADSTVKCWGSGLNGALGNGSGANTSSLTPVSVPGISTAINVSVVNIFGGTCAILEDQSLWCWGIYSYASASSSLSSYTPVKIEELASVLMVSQSAESATTCVVIQGGSMKCWGYNSRGQLGNGSTTGSLTPVVVDGISNAVSVTAGGGSMCAVLTDRTVKCWGYNYFGQLGNGLTTDRSTPIVVAGISDAVSVSAGNTHSCATLIDGLVKCWGSNSYGSLGRTIKDRGKVGFVQKLQTVELSSPTTKTLGTEEFVVETTSSGNLEVTIRSNTGLVCEASGNKVIVKQAGNCTIYAYQGGNAYFSEALSAPVTFDVTDWTGSRTNSTVTFKIQTNDGAAVTGLRITWSTLGAENPASGTANVTNSAGTVTMSVITGPVIIRVSSLYHADDNVNFRKSSVSQYLNNFSAIKVLSSGIVTVDVGTRPVTVNKVFSVRLADGSPVRGAVVFLAVTTNLWANPSRTISGKFNSNFATWFTSNQLDTVEPCFNDGNSFYDSSATNVKGITDSNGQVSLKTYVSSGSENLVTACYFDADFTQKRTVSIASTSTTAIGLGYMARINASVSEIVASPGENVSVSAQVVDANGSPVSSQSVQVMSGSIDSTARVLNCAGSSAVTNVSGNVSVRICPSESGYYFLKSNGVMSSQLIYVFVRSPASGGDDGGGGDDGPESDPPTSSTILTSIPVTTSVPRLNPSTSTLAPRNSLPSSNANVPAIPVTAGTIVTDLVQPKPALALGLAIATTANKITVGLKSPAATTTTAKISSYVVTVRSSTGAIVKRVTIAVKTANQTFRPTIPISKSGNYVIEISGKNSAGKIIGTYKSRSIKVGK